MAKIPETTSEWIAHYENLRYKAAQNYQETGDPKYDRAAYKYSVILDGLRALEREKDERDKDIVKRMRNRDSAVDQLLKEEYSKEEVIELLEKAVWW